MQKRIVILASGAGSNARQIIHHFADSKTVHVASIISDRLASGALALAREKGIDGLHIAKQEIEHGDLLEALQQLQPDLIVLAGFLRKIPEAVVEAYPQGIINVHPALLPKYGGPGMYGDHVHRAVLAAGEKESGISIHYVNEHFDEGALIAQFYCSLDARGNLDSLKTQIRSLEHRYLPLVIQSLLQP